MKYFFTSDTHFCHDNIIKYCNRPFRDSETMNECLVKSWNSVVSNDDVVFHLGDVGLGNRENLLTIIPSLNGKKYLVKGNHDTRNNQFFRDCGFIEVYDHPVIIKNFIVLSHEPLPFVMNQMYFSVYGHVHDSELHATKTDHSCCVCVERWNYCPVEDVTIFGHALDGFKNNEYKNF